MFGRQWGKGRREMKTGAKAGRSGKVPLDGRQEDRTWIGFAPRGLPLRTGTVPGDGAAHGDGGLPLPGLPADDRERLLAPARPSRATVSPR